MSISADPHAPIRLSSPCPYCGFNPSGVGLSPMSATGVGLRPMPACAQLPPLLGWLPRLMVMSMSALAPTMLLPSSLSSKTLQSDAPPMLPPACDTFSVPQSDILSRSKLWTGDMGAARGSLLLPLPGLSAMLGGGTGGGAIADVEGERFGGAEDDPELRSGVGRMTPTPQDTAPSSSPHGSTVELLGTGGAATGGTCSTAAAMGDPANAGVPVEMGVAPPGLRLLRSSCTFPEFDGMRLPLRLFLRRWLPLFWLLPLAPLRPLPSILFLWCLFPPCPPRGGVDRLYMGMPP
mmetsp:Transcript_39323/g.94622  ORF Transcript_39323/g.94622 Transcript_39323/m.94622 type:complete len:292 (-) Transcript_39323:569-1444(-)